MCGIAGVATTGPAVDVDDLRAMAATIRHRGPDDEGFYVSPSGRGGKVGLAFRRLSIIDVAGGHQPLANEDGSIWTIFNGEIYNFQQLRDELEAHGHRFRTRSDTEVIVHLWEERGSRLVEQLNGMFALAVWDETARTLFAARDRLGKKPLYFAELDGTILFGSEIKALLAHPACPRRLDEQALAEYLAFEYVPAPRSIFHGIRKLEPGHSLLWRDGQVHIERYWEPRFDPAPPRSEDEWCEELVDRLRESVRKRLISDVPLGVFLSGGVDSAAIVAMMAELLPAAQIKSFSIGFDEPSFDETAHARAVAAHFGTDHHEHIVRADDMAHLLPDIAGFLDEPLGDASIVPTYVLSRFTRENVTVALSGDGGDELFAGYPTFVAHRAANLYRVPRVVHEAFTRAADRLPVSTANFSLDFKIKRFLSGAREPLAIRDQVWLGSLAPDQQQDILVSAVGDAYEPLRLFTGDLGSLDDVHRLVAQYLRFYLEGDILVKVDRASMANSLEVRAPLLDHTFVSFVNSMPSNLKLHGLRSKYILKRALNGRVPDAILRRPKKGFGIPVADWLNGELRELADDLLLGHHARSHDLIDTSAVRELVDEHRSGRRDNRKPLWTLLIFELWYRHWLLRAPVSAGAAAGGG